MSTKKRNTKVYLDYEYEKLYQEDLEKSGDVLIEHALKDKKRSNYATKEIYAGEQLEVEIYPEFRNSEAKELPRETRKRNKAQTNLNDKNARKEFLRLANHNFNNGDFWITFTYDEKNIPGSIEEACKNMHNYIIAINRKRKRRGLNNARYIYITEYNEGPNKIRYHHHLLMDCEMDMDIVESTWKKGRRNQIRRLSKDEYGLAGMANYLTKNPRGKKRWCRSTNLVKPPVKKNHYKFKKNRVKKMVMNRNIIQGEFEKQYPNFIFTDIKIYFNDFNGGCYMYVRMRRKD